MKIVFTDLDGTLLNHNDYSYKEALEALALLKKSNTPLVINTSKTKEEVLELRRELENSDPFIVENGAGVFFPSNYEHPLLEDYGDYKVCILGEKRSDILKVIKPLKKKYGLTGFSDMNLIDVATHTGLSLEDARKAKVRDFTEPFIMEDRSKLSELKEEIGEGIDITEGGRFFHFISKKQDKGLALIKTKEILEKVLGEACVCIALGDGKNDHAMLSVADIPVLIPKPDGVYENRDIKNHIKAKYPGAKGWNEVIKEILNES